MATKLKRPCRYRGCNQLVNSRSGYCEKHKQQAHINYRKSRTDTEEQKFYGSKIWREASLAYRQEHPVCEVCKVKPSRLVHHKEHIKQGGAPLDKRNFQAVCYGCQAKEHRQWG